MPYLLIIQWKSFLRRFFTKKRQNKQKIFVFTSHPTRAPLPAPPAHLHLKCDRFPAA
jgi:hypothetical protein